jgi:hypothetical protein
MKMKRLLSCAGIVLLWAGTSDGRPVDPYRELLITDPSVVDNPDRTTDPCDVTEPGHEPKVWDFGNQLRNLAVVNGADDASLFAEKFFDTWRTDQTINGFIVAARNNPEEGAGIDPALLVPWRERSGGGPLDLGEAPYRLQAISIRPDLRQPGLNAGEIRFIYAAIVQQQFPRLCEISINATVIFEYKMIASSDEEILAWAEHIHHLGSPRVTDYNQALQELTDRAMRDGITFDPASGQVRTNEVLFRPQGAAEGDQAQWEMRQFKVEVGEDRMPALIPSVVDLTPDRDTVNNTALFGQFINENRELILEQKYTVPLVYQGVPFLGGAAHNEASGPITPWNAPEIVETDPPQLRHLAALNTCNGCHSVETGTRFTQFALRRKHEAAVPSGFLTGIDVPDPIDPRVMRHFNELGRRVADLQNLINSGGRAPPQFPARPD